MEGLYVPGDTPSGPNCGVTAVAVVASVPFTTAKQAFQQARLMLRGKPYRRSWKGSTQCHERKKALQLLGVKFKGYVPPRMTLEHWVDQHTCRDVSYLVTTTGHCQVVRNGHVSDQIQEAVKIEHYRWKRKHVQHVFEIKG